jgi:hypothetical protein
LTYGATVGNGISVGEAFSFIEYVLQWSEATSTASQTLASEMPTSGELHGAKREKIAIGKGTKINIKLLSILPKNDFLPSS